MPNDDQLGRVNWQAIPEGLRLGALAQLLHVSTSNAARIMASMAFARNEKNALPGGVKGAGPYQTQLPPNLEQVFEQWATKNDLFNPRASFPDYDMRGFFQAMLQHDPQAAYKLTPDLHILFPDRFVTPYSLDFGPKSIYWKQQK